MVEVLFLLLGATLAFVYMQYEQKKDLEKRVKTLESDYVNQLTHIDHIERSLSGEISERIHSLKADMWQHKLEHENSIREKEINKLLKD